jgi:hypothetical protein
METDQAPVIEYCFKCKGPFAPRDPDVDVECVPCRRAARLEGRARLARARRVARATGPPASDSVRYPIGRKTTEPQAVVRPR